MVIPAQLGTAGDVGGGETLHPAKVLGGEQRLLDLGVSLESARCFLDHDSVLSAAKGPAAGRALRVFGYFREYFTHGVNEFLYGRWSTRAGVYPWKP